MATKKITVTIEEGQAEQIRGSVASGSAASVSGFVHYAVGLVLDDTAGLGPLLAEALRETGGSLTAEERAWADSVLGTQKRHSTSAA